MRLPASETSPSPTVAPAYHLATLVCLTSSGSLLFTEMPKALTWMLGSSGASRRERKEEGHGTSTSYDPHCPQGTDGALTVDTELDAALLRPRALALAQENAFIMGGDMCQGQSSPFVLEAEPVLVLPRFTLTLALTHTEDECRLLLVDLRGGGRRGGGPGPT